MEEEPCGADQSRVAAVSVTSGECSDTNTRMRHLAEGVAMAVTMTISSQPQQTEGKVERRGQTRSAGSASLHRPLFLEPGSFRRADPRAWSFVPVREREGGAEPQARTASGYRQPERPVARRIRRSAGLREATWLGNRYPGC